MDTENDLEISRPAYEWTGRAISILKKRLGVNITAPSAPAGKTQDGG